MPSLCRCYVDSEESPTIDPQELILDFLTNIVDLQIRQLLEQPTPLGNDITIEPWLNSLAETDINHCDLPSTESKRLKMAFDHWTLPIQDNLITSDFQLSKKQYRICFKLNPPAPSENNYDNWKLDYYLQAIDNPDFLVPSEQIWQHSHPDLEIDDRTIENPQEILLKGLGLASKIYPLVAKSLENAMPNYCQLNAIDAYQFIRSSVWQLQDNGLGIILPEGLAEGAGEKRLGVKIEAKVNLKKRRAFKSQ